MNSTDLQKHKFNLQPQTKFETLKAEYISLIEQIKKEVGTLEQIRTRLALSRRQICKLLMVDPSAWTRWTKNKDGQDAPPHIYQSLKWYMQLIEKNPDVHAPLKLEQKMELIQKDSAHEISKIKKEFQDYLKSTSKVAQTQDPSFERLGEVLSENFKKFSDSIQQNNDPKKALELEIIKYDNKKFQDKIATLEARLSHVAAVNEKLSATIDKLVAIQKNLSHKKEAKKKPLPRKNRKLKTKGSLKKLPRKKTKLIKKKIRKGRQRR